MSLSYTEVVMKDQSDAESEITNQSISDLLCDNRFGNHLNEKSLGL